MRSRRSARRSDPRNDRRRRDDLVEGVGAVRIAVDLDQGVEVVPIDGVVDLVVGDVPFDSWSRTPPGLLRACLLARARGACGPVVSRRKDAVRALRRRRLPWSWKWLRVRTMSARVARLGSSTHHESTRTHMPTIAWASTSESRHSQAWPSATAARRRALTPRASRSSTRAPASAASPPGAKTIRNSSR